MVSKNVHSQDGNCGSNSSEPLDRRGGKLGSGRRQKLRPVERRKSELGALGDSGLEVWLKILRHSVPDGSHAQTLLSLPDRLARKES